MATHCTLRRVPHDYGVADPDDFMTSYRYSLTNVIESEQAIPWLMHNGILDHEDREIILHGHKTSVLRAGDLIDTVLRRGPQGFNVLMEFIEYEYPELYEKMMSKPAREPDHKVYKRRGRKSTRLSVEVMDVIGQLWKIKETCKQQRRRAEGELQAKIADIQTELEMKEGQILELTQKVMEVTARNKELSEQAQQAQKDRSDAVRLNNELRQQRDEARQQVISEEDKHMSHAKNFRESVKKNKNTTADSQLHEEINKLKMQLKHQPSRQDSINEEIKKQERIIAELERENKMLLSERDCLTGQVDHLAEEFDLCDNRIMKYREQADNFKKERDWITQQYEDLKEKYEVLQDNNNHLKNQMIDNNCQLRILKNEAVSCRPRLKRIVDGIRQEKVDPAKAKQAYQERKEKLEDSFTSFDTSTSGQYYSSRRTIPECDSPIATSSSEDEYSPGTSNRPRSPMPTPQRRTPEQCEDQRYPLPHSTNQGPHQGDGHHALKRSDGAFLNLVVNSVVMATSSCVHDVPQSPQFKLRSAGMKSEAMQYQSRGLKTTMTCDNQPTSSDNIKPKVPLEQTSGPMLPAKPVTRPKLSIPKTNSSQTQLCTALPLTNQMVPTVCYSETSHHIDQSQPASSFISRSVIAPKQFGGLKRDTFQKSKSLPSYSSTRPSLSVTNQIVSSPSLANHMISTQNKSNASPQLVNETLSSHSLTINTTASSFEVPSCPLYHRRHPSRNLSPSSPETGPFHRQHRLLSGKKKCPLVLYAPVELRTDLQTHLLEQHSNCFISCIYDEFRSADCRQMLTAWIEEGKCIHYTEECGGVFRGLGTETLKFYMKKENSGRVLLDVPVEAVQRMYSQKIHPLVLIIKYTDLENRGELSEEEEEMNKMHHDFRPKYEKLMIDRSISMDTIASMIVHKVAAWDTRHSSGIRKCNCNAAAPGGST